MGRERLLCVMLFTALKIDSAIIVESDMRVVA